MPAVGDTWRSVGPNPVLYHVRAIVDQDGSAYVAVLRYWHKARWYYRTATCHEFELSMFVKVD